jgi:type VI protein secretion system component Hcp
MDSDSGDLLLKMMLKGNPVKGNAQTELTAPGKQVNPLAQGFEPGKMMEIDSFSMRIGTQGSETGSDAEKAEEEKRKQKEKEKNDKGKKHDKETKEYLSATAKRGGYQAWRSGAPHKGYPLDIQPITFERSADMTSKDLIQSCMDCTSFDSATIIKRKPIGSEVAGEVYLRIDFSGVLITKVDWADEDEYVKEVVSFIARGITMSYRPQTSSGGLGPIVSGFWSLVGEKQMTFG